MTRTNDKNFDCMAMKSNIHKQIYNETKNMSVNELLLYYNGKKTLSITPDRLLRVPGAKFL